MNVYEDLNQFHINFFLFCVYTFVIRIVICIEYALIVFFIVSTKWYHH